MGSLILPSSGPVYADALIFIYSVEKHPIYALTLRPLWEAVARGDLEVLSSELTLMETLIGPLKQGDAALETDYENFFASPGIRLLPITSSILRAGARLREQSTNPRCHSSGYRPFLQLLALPYE
ncbi:MAG: PIN domain-containing protein [Isosphaeraceae bacterium]